jgi:hypothetical protein
VGLTTLPSADCLKLLEALNSWHPQGLSRPVMGLLYLAFSDNTVGIVTRLQTGRPRNRGSMLARDKRLYCLQNLHSTSDDDIASNSRDSITIFS